MDKLRIMYQISLYSSKLLHAKFGWDSETKNYYTKWKS